MQKGILLSTRPKWVEKIAHKIGEINGKAIYEKTIEVRKTKPKFETPFKVYIYCTKDGLVIYGNGKQYVTDSCEFLKGSAVEAFENSSGFYKWNGKVIGEFVCDRIYTAIPDYNPPMAQFFNYDFYNDKGERLEDCLTGEQLSRYGDGVPLYGWHITDLKIYDKPKELSEFRKYCGMVERFEVESVEFFENCINCPNLIETDSGLCSVDCGNRLTRPPQSWCYVEAQE